MSSRVPVVLAGALLALAASSSAAAPTDPALAGWGRGEPYARLYDPAREVVVAATVVRVERFVPAPAMAEGVRVLVDTGHLSVWVHLGPAAFVEAQSLKLAAGDPVSITGATARTEDGTAVIAARVESRGRAVRLRDASGRPLWVGFRSHVASDRNSADSVTRGE